MASLLSKFKLRYERLKGEGKVKTNRKSSTKRERPLKNHRLTKGDVKAFERTIKAKKETIKKHQPVKKRSR